MLVLLKITDTSLLPPVLQRFCSYISETDATIFWCHLLLETTQSGTWCEAAVWRSCCHVNQSVSAVHHDVSPGIHSMKSPLRSKLQEHENLNIHQCDKIDRKRQKLSLRKWRRQGLWPILKAATRWRSRRFGFTFGSCCVVHVYLQVGINRRIFHELVSCFQQTLMLQNN